MDSRSLSLASLMHRENLYYSSRTLIQILFLLAIRRGALLILFLITSIPVAILTSYSLILPIFVEESKNFATLLVREQPTIILDKTMDTCIEIYVANGSINISNKTVNINIILVNTTIAKKLLRECEKCEDSSLFLGSHLSSILSVKKGSKVEICIDNTCMYLNVSGIIGGRGLTSTNALLIYPYNLSTTLQVDHTISVISHQIWA